MDWPQKLRLSVFLILSQAALARAQPISGNSPELDFQAVLKLVREASPALKRGQFLVDASESTSAATVAQSAPNLQLSNSIGWQKSASHPRQQHALGLSATLWDFGRQSAEELKAKANLDVSRAQLNEFGEALKARTARYYVALAASQAVMKVAQEQSKNAESKLSTVIAAYKRGERPQTDVVKLKVELGRSQIFLAKSQDEFFALTSQLQLTTRTFSATQEVVPSLRIKPLVERSDSDWRRLGEKWQQQTLTSSTLQKLEAGERALQADLRSLEANFFPIVGGSIAAQGNGSLHPVKPDFLAQLNLQYNFPLSSGLSFKRSALLARLAEIKLAAEEERKIRSDRIIQSRIRLEGLTKTIELQRAQIQTLLDYQLLVRTRYFAGRASLLELTTTEDDLLSNRIELTRLQTSLYTAALDAAEALGGTNLENLF